MRASRLHITRLVLATVLVSVAVLAQTSAAARVKTVPIINVYSHHPVDIKPGGFDASTQPYANAFLWKNPAKDFDLIYSAGGDTKAFKIRVRDSGLCLLLDFRAPYRNGTRVIQYNCEARNIGSRWWYAKRVIAPAPPGEPQSDYPPSGVLVHQVRRCRKRARRARAFPWPR